MPWLWRIESSPPSNTIVVDIKGSITDYCIFSLYGIYICHNATSTKQYVVETYDEYQDETRTYFGIMVPPDLPVKIESDEPLISSIGSYSGSEHLRIRAVTGGEPTLYIGVKIKGAWLLVTGYGMYV